MADCSYARCIQERRYIRRELAKWTKNMVHIVGLERVAEELMGRRKWKHYQDVLTRQQLNLLDPSTNTVAVDDDDLLDSAAAAVATGVASNAVPFTPALVAAAVGGNLLDQKGAATIVRNGHYQQDGELESKLATANNQQVAVAAATDKQADHHPLAEAATVATRKNHFNENDTKPTATAATPSPPSTAPHQHPVAVTLNNNNNNNNNNNHHHHPHLLNQTQLVEGKKVRSDLDQPENPEEQQREDPATREDLCLLGTTSSDGKIVNSVASPALSCSSSSSAASTSSASSSAASTTTTATATTAALLSPSAAGATSTGVATELDDRKELVGKLAIKLEPTAENQNISPAPPEQSKLIKQEHCNNLLSSKIIINNNNSATNNNNNNISSGNLGDGGLPVSPATVAADEESTTVGGGEGGSSKLPRSQPPTPIDWKPQDKCYFCVDGKLLTVNEAGELVPESGLGVGGPNVLPKTELDLSHGVLNDSDSDSSDSSEPDLRAVVGRPGSASTKSLAALLRNASGVPPTMTSLQSMAAQFAAVASLQGIQPGLAQLYSPLWYSQLQQQLSPSGSTETAVVGGVGAAEKGEGTVLGPGGEQPLDLSAKPGTSGLNAGLMMSMMDPKQIYKAKPRLSPIGGRRTYTEDELQSALQDILNGKLGTRRAAVQYGIPRSTLRNKVYKLAMEHKREMLHNMSLAALVDDDDDKDSLEDEGKDDPYSMKLNQQAFAEAYLRVYRGNSSTPKLEPSSSPATPPQQQRTPEPPLLKPIQTQTPQPTVPPQSSPLAAAANSLIDPSLLLQLQSLLLAGGIPGLTNTAAQSNSPEEAAAAQAALAALPELLKKLIQQQELIAEQIKKATSSEPRPSAVTPTLNNGQPIDPRLLPFLQAQQQNKPRTASGTPETTSSLDLNDGGSDDSQVILKIPSYKPVPGSAPTMPATAAALLAAGKNGDHHSLSTPSPPTATATSAAATVRDLSSLVSGTLGAPGPSTASNSSRPVHNTSPQQPQQQNPAQPPNHLSVISPPMGIRPRSSSQSPPNSLLGGKSMLSINDVIARSISKNFQQHHQSDLLKQQMESMEQYKRPTISVIKNLGGTDISRFGSNPNITQMTAAQLANTGTGGKGTRPKRGKYRNYDRDSLVEAVKAVQRGEMSVHRAGSYYGVPHSTLEYKVKERHLMRPRKREPKPQPGLDGLKSDLGASSSVMRTLDKSKSLAGLGSSSKQQQQQQQQQLKSQYASASPNGGLKMPMFDPTMASQLPYASPFLWPHPAGFTGLPMDFARQSAGAGASTSGPSSDNIFASPMLQRFQQEQQQSSKVPNPSGTNAPKTARELAESIYDGTSTNGSLLDDIIRHSLDKKPGEMPHGALFDQLMKSNLRTSTATGSEDPSAALLARVGAKRSATSPLNYLPDNIKRERASPGASSTSSTGSTKPAGLGSVSFNDHHHHHQQQQQQQQHQQQQLHLQQQQQQRHLNTSTDSMLDTHSLLAKGNLAVESLIKLREDLTSMSVAHHHQRTSMEDQHNGAKDDPSSSGRAEQQPQQHQQQQQLLSHRLASQGKHLPTEDSS